MPNKSLLQSMNDGLTTNGIKKIKDNEDEVWISCRFCSTAFSSVQDGILGVMKHEAARHNVDQVKINQRSPFYKIVQLNQLLIQIPIDPRLKKFLSQVPFPPADTFHSSTFKMRFKTKNDTVVLRPQPHHDEALEFPCSITESEEKSSKAPLPSCNICHRKFKKTFSLTKHMRTVHAPCSNFCSTCNRPMKTQTYCTYCTYKPKLKATDGYSCKVCGIKFARAFTGKRHELTHTGTPKPVSCLHCSSTFWDNSTMMNHVQRVHKDPNKSRWINCDVCKRSFGSSSGLKSHKCGFSDQFVESSTLYSIDDGEQPQELPMLCPEENEVGVLPTLTEEEDPLLLIGVEEEDNRQDGNKVQLPVAEEKEELLNSLPRIKVKQEQHTDGIDVDIHYEGTMVNQSSKSKPTSPTSKSSATEKIQVIITDNKCTKCLECGATHKSRTSLMAHLENQHNLAVRGVAFKCTFPLCTKQYKTKELILKHIRSHTSLNYKRHLCPVPKCPSSFVHAFQLKFHIRTHTGEKPFQCSFCDKRFIRELYKRRHELKHTKNRKSFGCSYCDKQLQTKESLKLHERIHTGEKPLICRYCPRAFRRFSDRSGHERTHLQYLQEKSKS